MQDFRKGVRVRAVVFLGRGIRGRYFAFVFPVLFLSSSLLASEEAWLRARSGSSPLEPAAQCKKDIAIVGASLQEPESWKLDQILSLHTGSLNFPLLEARVASRLRKSADFWQLSVRIEKQKYVLPKAPIETYHNHEVLKGERTLDGIYQLLLFPDSNSRRVFLQRSTEAAQITQLQIGPWHAALFDYEPLRRALSREEGFVKIFDELHALVEAPDASVEARLKLLSDTARRSGFSPQKSLPTWMQLDVSESLKSSYVAYRKARDSAIESERMSAKEALIHDNLRSLRGPNFANREITFRMLWVPSPIDFPPTLFFQGSDRVENDLTHNEMLELISLQFPDAWIQTGYLLNFVRPGIITLHFDKKGELKNFEIPPHGALNSQFYIGKQLVSVKSSKTERDALAIQMLMHWEGLTEED